MKIQGKIAFSIALVLSLTLVVSVVSKVPGLKSKADNADELKYFDANFFDYEQSTNSYDKNDKAKLLFGRQNPGQADSEHNTWRTETEYKVVQGLVNNTLADGTVALNGKAAISGQKQVTLFDTKDAGTFRNSYKFPFKKNTAGYYEYDSDMTHVEITTPNENMKRLSGKTEYGFMPLNKIDANKKNGSGQYQVSNPNYYFGMSMAIEFVMPENGCVDGKDMEFNFSGDDDMWVYIDNNLVLDLGGVHTAVDGKINFAKGTVTTTGNHLENGAYQTCKKDVVKQCSYLKNLTTNQAHKLQIFYLERGASVSKCKITFRLEDPKPAKIDTPVTPVVTPQPTVEPTKQPQTPTITPTVEPTKEVVVEPTKQPEVVPTKEPIVEPTNKVEEPEETVEPVVMPATTEEEDDDNEYVAPAKEKEVPVVEEEKEEEKEPAVVKAVKGILPQTGTLEEYIFYIVGGLLIAGGISLVILQRMKVKKTDENY
jgi:fibro-slime domain-containing protein/LPXTG-motif cell wall-anchored protein